MDAIRLKTTGELWFEDFAVGAVIEAEAPPLTEEEIVAFGSRWDLQYFHTDPEAAKSSMFGGLIASGWHTGATLMRMICDAYLLRAARASLGSPGLDNVRWLKPVRPGDRLRMRMEVLESRPSRSRPDRGSVRQKWEVFNQANEVVMTMEGWNLLLKRPDDAPGAGGGRPEAAA